MIDISALIIFIPTIFIVSITPGMCMTLAMTLGMSVGIRKTMYMMWGELLGVAIVAISAVIGVSAIMLRYPNIFIVLKCLGALYLTYVGINMWRSKGKLALNQENQIANTQSSTLFYQGLITAIANPKGWAFMISLLPPFLSAKLPIAPQLAVLLTIILLSEFICMMLYATGGKTVGKILTEKDKVKLLNKASGTLMIGVAIWLLIG